MSGPGVQNGPFPWALGGFLGVGGRVDRVDAEKGLQGCVWGLIAHGGFPVARGSRYPTSHRPHASLVAWLPEVLEHE